MVSSTPTNKNSPWRSLRKEIRQEIMNTDILCEIVFQEEEETLAKQCLEQVFVMMRSFADRYSRFKIGNVLWQFNESTTFSLTPEFFDILTLAKRAFEQTGGVFDPSILPTLHNAGYQGAPHQKMQDAAPSFSELILDPETLTATKPRGLLIDLGGIGKGYIVDQVSRFLAEHFENFLVDAGGDIFVKGVNKKEDYSYWAIDVEHPHSQQPSPALLLLTDTAVATSGSNRRHWIQNGVEQHHIINPATQKSAETEFLSVTVIAENTLSADVFAKTLFIAGKERGQALAEQHHLPAIFIEHTGTVHINQYAEPYVWKKNK